MLVAGNVFEFQDSGKNVDFCSLGIRDIEFFEYMTEPCFQRSTWVKVVYKIAHFYSFSLVGVDVKVLPITI